MSGTARRQGGGRCWPLARSCCACRRGAVSCCCRCRGSRLIGGAEANVATRFALPDHRSASPAACPTAISAAAAAAAALAAGERGIPASFEGHWRGKMWARRTPVRLILADLVGHADLLFGTVATSRCARARCQTVSPATAACAPSRSSPSGASATSPSSGSPWAIRSSASVRPAGQRIHSVPATASASAGGESRRAARARSGAISRCGSFCEPSVAIWRRRWRR